ncbi:ribonuclease P protein component [Leucothrix sargassi]|nr:ribonuclease P protein component [Leucothrix sargassi]
MTDYNFSRKLRLTKAEDYEYVFANAKRFGNHNFTLLVRKNNLGHARLGLAIAKKSVKLASDRNRIKRLIRENFRHELSSLPPVDIIAMCRRGAVELPNHEISAQLDTQWRYIRRKIQG